MGFLDKATQLADQAQAKIDEAQDKFNASQRKDAADDGPRVRYDQHGRPVAEPETEQAGATPPHGDPLAAPEPGAPPEPWRQHALRVVSACFVVVTLGSIWTSLS